MAGELVSGGNHLLFRPFDEHYVLHQRMEAPILSARASACYTPVQDLESKQMLMNFLDTNDYIEQYERFTSSIQYTLAFGMRIMTGKEWQLTASHKCLENIVAAAQPGAWIVDTLPFLNNLPWPLTPWKKTAKQWYTMWDDLHLANMKAALQRDGWNWTKDLKASKEAQQMTDAELAWDLGVLCDGGIETTQKMLYVFTLACLAYPGWIPTARKELEGVVGLDRLPTFSDLDKLPYIHAVVEETFRWHHIAPIGIPHATTADDYYKGYLIPKGSTVIPLISTMRTDASAFESPAVFRPERWIGKTQSNNFGYGRRVCPGRFIAKNSIAIAVSRLLWAFDIKSKDGRIPFVSEDMFTDEIISAPKPFDVVFEPRSDKHRQVVVREYESAEKDTAKMLDRVREMQVSAGLSQRG
jgi:cytochrome P450